MCKKDKYFGDQRYEKVWEQMKLLGIEDISSPRQDKNGTIVWKLPIKHEYGGQLIKVASFATGYVRNNNSGYSNYQLNKCKPRTEYFKDYKWVDDKQVFTGKYNKYICKERILIPIEIDRLEYLISYCLKNYYIKHANLVPNGDFVAKWKYDEAVDLGRTNAEAEALSDCGHYNRIRDLENKLDTIQRISEYGETE